MGEKAINLNDGERQLVTAALAGQHPPHLEHLRPDVIKKLARADRDEGLLGRSSEGAVQ